MRNRLSLERKRLLSTLSSSLAKLLVVVCIAVSSDVWAIIDHCSVIIAAEQQSPNPEYNEVHMFQVLVTHCCWAEPDCRGMNDCVCGWPMGAECLCCDQPSSWNPDCATDFGPCGGTNRSDFSCSGDISRAVNYNYICWLVRRDCRGYPIFDQGNASHPVAMPPPKDGQTKPEKLDVEPANTSPTNDPPYEFDDVLDIEIVVDQDMVVSVLFKTSTYEGRCMNFPALTEGDTISDMMPDTLTWTLISRGYEYRVDMNDYRSWFLLQKPVPAGRSHLYIEVRDYAAEGDLIVWESENPNNADSLQIPENYVQWREPDDEDGDGITLWEEYRGFQAGENHFRLHPGTNDKDIIVIDQENMFSLVEELANWKGNLEQIIDAKLSIYPIIETNAIACGGGFSEELDIKQALYNGSDWQTVLYALALPYYNLPCSDNPVKQVAAIRLQYEEATQGEYGHCQVVTPDGNGPPGCVGVFLQMQRINSDINMWDQLCGLNDPRTDRVRQSLIRRALAHEFGHVLDIDDHSPFDEDGTDESCLMYSPFSSSYVHQGMNDDNWSYWENHYGDFAESSWGFKSDNFSCQQQTLYRPEP